MEVEQAVIIKFNYGLADLEPFYNLFEKLSALADESGTGEYDGHEIAIDLSDGFFFLIWPRCKSVVGGY